MKPDFAAMSIAELRAYLLTHREEDDAFHELADRLEHTEASELYPAPNSPETIAIMEAAIQEQVQKLERRD